MWTGGTIAGGGTLTIATTAMAQLGGWIQLHGSMAVAGVATLAEGTSLQIGQTVYDAGSGLWVDEPVTLSILAGGRFEITDWVTVSGPWNGELASEIVNAGTLVKTGNNESRIQGTVDVINSGTLEVQESTLWLDGDTTSTGTVTVAAEATLKLSGDAIFTAGSTFDVYGTVHIQGGTTTIEGDRTIAAVVIDWGTLSIDADTTIGGLAVNGGTAIFNGESTVTGDLIWTGGIIAGPGSLTIAAVATATLGSPGTSWLYPSLHGTLAVAGLATLSSFSWLELGRTYFDSLSNGWVDEPGTLTILDGGRFEIAGSAYISAQGSSEAPSQIINYGTLVKIGDGDSHIQSTINFFNSGTLAVEEGVLHHSSGEMVSTGTVTVAAGATFTIGETATFTTGSVFEIYGTFHVQGGTTTIEDSQDIDAVIISSGWLLVGDGTTIGTLTINGSGQITGDTSIAVLTLNGGTLTVAGDLVVTQEFAPDGGVINLASGSFLDLSPGNGPAVVNGSGEGDTVIGTAFDDELHGGGGDDILIGGLGNDTLSGGQGVDRFVFRSPDEGVDTIIDFALSEDVLVIDASVFEGGLVAGESLSEGQFVSGESPVATEEHGQFLFDSITGDLFWDVDGVGGQEAVQLATLVGAPNLTASDFELVGSGGHFIGMSEVTAAVQGDSDNTA